MRTRTRFTLAALVLGVVGLVAGSALAVVPVNGPAPTLSPVTINASPGDQTDPHVSGDWAAYSDGHGIRYYNFATGLDAQIPTPADGWDSLSDVSGSKIVFSRYYPPNLRIGVMVFDAATPGAAPIELAQVDGSNRPSSAIGGDTVAWIDLGLEAYGELVIHDLATNIAIRITFDTVIDQNPAVSPDGNVVVWEHCVTGDSLRCDIRQAVKSGSTWVVNPVTTTAEPDGNPDSNGDIVVYDSARSGNSDIYWTPVGLGSAGQLELPGWEKNPSIAGRYIGFESGAFAGASADLFVYDLVENRLYQLTSTPANEQLNDITVLSDGRVRVIWATDEDGGSARNIKAATFALADSVAPVLTVPANVTVSATSPAGAIVTFTATATDDGPASPTVTCTPPSGSTFAAGSTTVNCTATDAAGNSTPGSFTVTVLSASTQIGDLIDKTRTYLGLTALPPALKTQLQGAVDALVAGHKPAACLALQLYVALVRAAPVTTLNATQKADLIADATRIRNAIGC
jgi:Tol biopolymer transport system component